MLINNTYFRFRYSTIIKIKTIIINYQVICTFLKIYDSHLKKKSDFTTNDKHNRKK